MLAVASASAIVGRMSQTVVSITGEDFHLNGRPTYPGRAWRGLRIEGLLLNSRMVQATFDDLNPATRSQWDYADGPWDAERNVREFIAAMPSWHRCGLLAVTLNLQGGNPRGYVNDQPWHNSAFTSDGRLRPDYMDRLARVLDAADALGMVVILGLFYFGQDERLADEQAVIRAADNATDWLLDRGDRHVLIEVGNEVDFPRYEHPIIARDRGHELIERIQQRSRCRVDSPAGRLLVSTSMRGGGVPTPNIVNVADYLLLHGNGVHQPDGIRKLVDDTRGVAGYRGQPIVFNEDDHFDFDKADNNFLAALSRRTSWGYFDYREQGEPLEQGFQSVPVDWGINSPRKQAFFSLLAEITGS